MERCLWGGGEKVGGCLWKRGKEEVVAVLVP